MSEFTLISPLLDGFAMGHPISEHDGTVCCPAIRESSGEKYIVKIISVPQSQVQLEALLLTGAYSNPAEAAEYFRDVAQSIVEEAELLSTLGKLEGFLPFEGWQIVPMEDGQVGYYVYLLSPYSRSLERFTSRNPVTHLQAVNLGLDLCTALSICRRSGYLYVNLKPSNVYLTKKKDFRIGDLGFVRLDSLEYMSLPGKYRSAYSPRETMDDMKTLNSTVDTYAVGMILYQIYNEGSLPAPPLEPKDPFPCPSNADYEISAIIMKALEPDPAKRWETPMQMGQALVGYMQRNSINNVAITPPTGIIHPESPMISQQKPEKSAAPEAEPVSSLQPEPIAEAAPVPEENHVQQTNDDPAEPEVTEPKTEEPEISTGDLFPDEDLDFSLAFQDTPEEPADMQKKTPPEPVVRKPVRKDRKTGLKRFVSALIVLVILVGLCCGGLWFYQNLYLQEIRDLTISGSQNQLIVTVDSDADPSLLQVSCTDTYGNTTTQSFRDGQAVFTDLLPDSLYRIELSISGFHALTGKTAEIFTTEAQTEIISISAISGPEDGSVILNFTANGPEASQWTVTCTAEGEETVSQSFAGHTVTVKGLTVGKTYQIALSAGDGAPLLGTTTLDYVASRLILAENLTIVSCVDGLMTVRWDAPADTSVESWNVRCYNDQGHEEVLQIAGTEIALSGIETDKAYTVEVTAAGMTEPNRVSISANPLTISDFAANASGEDEIHISWSFDGEAPEGGWLLLYSLDDQYDQQSVVKCPEPNAVIDNRIPGAIYQFTVQAVDSTSIFNNTHSFHCPQAGIFSNEGLSATNITSQLLKTPEEEDWTCESVSQDVFTGTFRSGDSISIVLRGGESFYLTEMDIEILYVIRNDNGSVLNQHTARETVDWKALWYDDDYHNSELDIPNVPTEPGNYSVSIYFNNLAVTSANFEIIG